MTRLPKKVALWGLTLLTPIALAACYGPPHRGEMPRPEGAPQVTPAEPAPAEAPEAKPASPEAPAAQR